MLGASHTDTKGMVDVSAGASPSRRQLLRDLFQALHLKADVVNTGPFLPSLRASHLVVLKIENRQVNRPIAKEVARHDRNIDLANLGQAERVDIKPSCLFLILCRDGNVLDLRHGVFLLCSKRSSCDGRCPRSRDFRLRRQKGPRLRYATGTSSVTK